jgi:hypothetical protein
LQGEENFRRDFVEKIKIYCQRDTIDTGGEVKDLWDNKWNVNLFRMNPFIQLFIANVSAKSFRSEKWKGKSET